jgi:hypothetical protein
VGRNSVKDVVRADVWRGPVDSGVDIGPTFDRAVMEARGSALNFVAAELELIDTQTPYPRPARVAWEKIRMDQFADIPFLSDARAAIEARKGAR